MSTIKLSISKLPVAPPVTSCLCSQSRVLRVRWEVCFLYMLGSRNRWACAAVLLLKSFSHLHHRAAFL